jgi:hypothetical protein
VIDETGPCGAFFGPASSWRQVDEGYGGDLRWTYAWDEDRSNWARWQIELDVPGQYEISAWLVDGYASSTRAPYTIRHGGRETTVVQDLTGRSGWTRLGTVEFAADGDEWVALGDDSGESFELRRRVMVDALLLTRVVEGPEPDPEPDADTEPSPEVDAGAPPPDPEPQPDAGSPVRDEDAFATPDGFEDDDVRRGPTIVDGGSTGGGESGWPDTASSRDDSPGRASRVTGDTSNTAGCAVAGPSLPMPAAVSVFAYVLALRRRRLS